MWTKCNGFESSYSMGVSFAVIGWERLVGCGLRRRCCGVGSRRGQSLGGGNDRGGCDGDPEGLKAQCSEWFQRVPTRGRNVSRTRDSRDQRRRRPPANQGQLRRRHTDGQDIQGETLTLLTGRHHRLEHHPHRTRNPTPHSRKDPHPHPPCTNTSTSTDDTTSPTPRHHPPANSDPYEHPETVTFRPNIPETPSGGLLTDAPKCAAGQLVGVEKS